MPDILEARFVYTQDDGQVAMVGFADDQFETKNYVLLQRTLNPDGSDVAPGHESVHVTISDQDCSGYGGVKRFVLGVSKALLHLTPEFACKVGTNEQHLIVLQYPELDVQNLRNRLQLLFANSPGCLVLE